jgi:internalin A
MMTQDELLALIDQAAAEGWTKLDLSGQELTELPAAIGKLTQLETLILGKVTGWRQQDGKYTPILATNQLRTLPPALKKLEHLQALNLSANPWSGIPEVVFELPSLTSLTLAATELLEIPQSIMQLHSLAQLDLSDNQISEIPESIAQLTQLTRLHLGNNQISEIPKAIAQLTQLTQLSLWEQPNQRDPRIDRSAHAAHPA